MRKLAGILVVLTFIASWPEPGYSVTISDLNSTLTVNLDHPLRLGDFLTVADWNIDGRRLLVYEGFPSSVLQITHFHADHNPPPEQQIHAAGDFAVAGTTF
jgi:hypothetical protein